MKTMKKKRMKMIKFKENTFTPYSSDLIEGFTPTPITEQEPFFKWKGGKIPLSLWHGVNAFFEWAYKEFQSESIVQLFYNSSTGEWKAWAMPQFVGTGMTVSQSKEQEHWDIFDANQRRFLDGFDAFGSIHNHCKAGAFQSSTDADDERGKNGIHITVGNLTSPKYSTHFRVAFKREFYNPRLVEWFECEYNFSEEIKDLIIKDELAIPVESSFPEEWKTNCYKKVTQISPTIWRGHSFLTEEEEDSKVDTNLRTTDYNLDEVWRVVNDTKDFLSMLDFKAKETQDEVDELVNELEWVTSVLAENINESIQEVDFALEWERKDNSYLDW
jgi:hypothetical protein